MSTRIRRVRASLLATSLAVLGLLGDPKHASITHRSEAMALEQTATGTFEVRITPQSTEEPEEGTPLGRSRLEKQYRGDLEGTATGEMLTAVTATEGSAAYVALERVTGTLHGRQGTFVLEHRGVMARGDQHLAIAIVPDSGTGELEGLTGRMSIEITRDGHHYELVYSLPSGG